MSEQWSEWIDHKPGDPCPIRWATRGQWIWRLSRFDDEGRVSSLNAADDVDWIGTIKGYRYLLSAAPAGFVPPGAEKPWVPPQLHGHGPWVEYRCGDVLPNNQGQILLLRERAKKVFRIGNGSPLPFYVGSTLIAAYCVKLEDQPTQEQVEATQKPWSLEQDAADWAADSDLQNRPMFDADDVGVSAGKWDRFNARLAAPTAAPGFMVRAVRSSDGLLTVREADHRLGLWS